MLLVDKPPRIDDPIDSNVKPSPEDEAFVDEILAELFGDSLSESFPDHLGRPGFVGGSLPRGEGGGTAGADRGKYLFMQAAPMMLEYTPANQRAAIENIEKLVPQVLDTDAPAPEPEEDEDIYAPETWEMVSQSEQEETETKWKEKSYDDFYQSEVDNYWSEMAAEDAARQMFDGKQDDWAADKLLELLEDRGVDLEQSGLLDEKGNIKIQEVLGELWGSDNYNAWDENGPKNENKDITSNLRYYSLKDNTELINSNILEKLVDEDGNPILGGVHPAGQMEFPGMPTEPDLIEREWTKDLLSDYETEILKYASDDPSKIVSEAPDYIGESVSEYQDEYWSQMDDVQKYDLAKDYFGDSWETKETPEVPEQIKMPHTFKTDEDGIDYERTKALGNALVTERFEELVKSRDIKGLAGNSPAVIDRNIRGIIEETWSSWKSDAGRERAYAMQAAVSAELGGKFYQSRSEKSYNDAVSWANSHIPGGFDTMKAYVRAQWETTQYILDKAGIKEMTLYRSVFIETSKLDATVNQNVVNNTWGNSTALPNLFIPQNGAASFTKQIEVANDWHGVGYKPKQSERVVIRATVPAEAIFSMPCYGKNIHGEQEYVVAGLRWKSWDAWRGRAPRPDGFPLGHQRERDGKFKMAA